MTQEEHNMLVENNIMLKQLLYRAIKHSDRVTPEEFMANVVANLVSNRIDGV